MIKKHLLTKVLTLLLLLCSGVGKAWAQTTFTETANLSKVTSSNRGSGSSGISDGSCNGCGISWSGINSAYVQVPETTGDYYWKFDASTYVTIKAVPGIIAAGDELTVKMISANDNKNVGFALVNSGREVMLGDNKNIPKETVIELSCTLEASDINADGTISIKRPLSGASSEGRYFSFKITSPRWHVKSKANDNGTITITDSRGNDISAGDYVPTGEIVTFTATPNAGYTFSNWNPTGISLANATNSVLEMEITQDTEMAAVFQHLYTVHIVSEAEKGSANLTLEGGAPVANGAQVPAGTNVVASANAKDGYSFANWSISLKDESDNAVASSLAPTENPYTLQMLQSELGKSGGAADAFDVTFTANYVARKMEWDFTSGWNTTDLSNAEKLGGLILQDGGSWRITSDALNSQTSGGTSYTIKVPASAGEFVTIGIQSYSNGKFQYEISGGRTTKNERGISPSEIQYVTVQANSNDGVIFKLISYVDGSGTQRSASSCLIKSIKITNDLAFSYPATTGSTATYDFTSGTDRTDGMSVTELYDGKFVPQTEDLRIRQKGSSWWLHNFGPTRTLTIRNVAEEQVIKLNFGNTSGNGNLSFNSGNATINGVQPTNWTQLISNVTEIVATKSGNIVLNCPSGAAIYGISITSSRMQLDLIKTAQYQPVIASGDYAGKGFSELLTNETHKTPSFAVASGTNAKFYGTDTFIRITNTGSFVVRATTTLDDGTVLTADLPIDVYANEATYSITEGGSKYTLTGEGMILEKEVTQVTKMKMTYGNGNEVALVKKDGSDYRAEVLDANGFTHTYVPSGLPTMGSYYVFEPDATGVLTVDAKVDAGSLVLMTSDKQNIAATLSSGNVHSYNVDRGKTYYLFSSGYITTLSSFTFTSTFKFATKSVTLSNHETSYQQTITDARVYSMVIHGDLTANIDATTGNITNISGDGGAIVVTARNNTGTSGYESDYYVITVPYSNHEWNFWQNFSQTGSTVNENNKGLTVTNDENGVKVRDYAVTYEVREYDDVTRELYYLNEAILSPNVNIAGNNAAYIGQTAGLLIDASPKTWGLRGTGKSLGEHWEEYKSTHSAETAGMNTVDDMSSAIRNELLHKMLAYNPEEIEKTSLNCAAMQRGATITIPNLKAGSYVAIKFFRHAPNSGDNIRITNVYDLTTTQDPSASEVEVTGNVQVVNQTGSKNVYNSKYGWLEFKVKQDGNVTLAVTDGGWTHIKKIAISDQGFMDTDLRLVIAGHTASTRYAYPGEPDNTNFKDIVQYENSSNQHMENGKGVKFYLKDVNSVGGADAIKITEGGKLTAKSAGTAVVVQKVYNSGTTYLIDYEETPIVITAEGHTSQEYPYTWDFANISSATQTSLTSSSDWGGNGTDGFTPTETGEAQYLQNSELCFNLADKDDESKDINEFEGLGFRTSINTSTGKTGGLDNMTIKPNVGLLLGNSEATTIVVPGVPEGATVYVRVNANVNTNVTLTPHYSRTLEEGEEEIIVTNDDYDKVVGDDRLYSVPGQGGDVEVTIQNATVKGIGVTNIYKECKFWDNVNDLLGNNAHQFCYHSDSHDVNLKYSLTKFYTDIEMKAYATGDYNSSSKKFTLVEVDVVPANEGLIVRTIDQNVLHPLFVPAVNDVVTTHGNGAFSQNLMRGFPHGADDTELRALDQTNYKYYGFTNTFYKLTEGSTLDQDTQKEAQLPGFYPLVLTGGSLAANRALLQMPKSSAAKVFLLSDDYMYGEDDDEATGIQELETLPTGDLYTITGVKINGVPTAKGIYIYNGKKVFIK